MRLQFTTDSMRDYRLTPTGGLIELIRNAFDADATRVDISFTRSGWDAVESVVVEDNGTGMNLETVQRHFLPVGRSWKRRTTSTTPSGRQLFGRQGRGRLGSFGLGNFVTWTSTTAMPNDPDKHQVVTIAWHGNDDAFDAEAETIDGRLASPRSTDPRESADTPGTVRSETGTRVVVTDLTDGSQRLPLRHSRRAIAEQFFDYLNRYPGLELIYDGHPIQPDDLLISREPVPVDIAPVRQILDTVTPQAADQGHANQSTSGSDVDQRTDKTGDPDDPDDENDDKNEEGPSPDADTLPSEVVIEVSQWEHNVPNTILLADENGQTLHAIAARVSTPGISFTARVNWQGNRLMRDAALEEMEPATNAMLRIVRKNLREHFQHQAEDARRALLDEWRTEDSYPYSGEPADAVERAERELFDIVAVTAAPTLRTSGPGGRQFALRLLKAALQTDAGAVRNVLEHVIGLADEDLAELDQLLNRIPLTSMIALQRTASDRIAFCAWLEKILNEDSWVRTLTERGGIQEIVENNVWIFGDDWQSVVTDRGLAKGLARLRELGMAGEGDISTVRDAAGRVIRVDLLLSRARKSAGRRHHLVVELKRPSQTLRKQELDQLDNYVSTVVTDPQFNDGRIDWTFILVGRNSDEYVDRKRSAVDRPTGLVDKQRLANGASYEMKVLTWSEIIEDAKARLAFLAEHLPEFPTEEDLAALTELHAPLSPTNPQPSQRDDVATEPRS